MGFLLTRNLFRLLRYTFSQTASSKPRNRPEKIRESFPLGDAIFPERSLTEVGTNVPPKL